MRKTSNALTTAEKVIYFRKRAELSQKSLEKLSGLGSGTINKLEKGSNNTSLETLLKISGALNLNLKETAFLLQVNLYKK